MAADRAQQDGNPAFITADLDDAGAPVAALRYLLHQSPGKKIGGLRFEAGYLRCESPSGNDGFEKLCHVGDTSKIGAAAKSGACSMTWQATIASNLSVPASSEIAPCRHTMPTGSMRSGAWPCRT